MSSGRLKSLEKAENDTLELMEIALETAKVLENMPASSEHLDKLVGDFASKVEGLRENLLGQSKGILECPLGAGVVKSDS